LSIIQNQRATTIFGEPVSISAKSFCIHGDNPGAIEILEKIDTVLIKNRIQKKAF